MTTPDLDAITAKWLQCLDDARAEINRLRAALDPDTHREPWAQQLFEQRDTALLDVQRLTAELDRDRPVVEKARAWRVMGRVGAGPGRPLGLQVRGREEVDLAAAVDAAYPPGGQT